MDKVKVVFFGEDSFSAVVLQSLIDAGYRILMVISPHYENNIHKRLELLTLRNEIPYFREKHINSPDVVKKLKNEIPNFIITAHFEKLLSSEIIHIPTHGCINLHPSLLPYYRGLAPQHWPIINGDTKTGVTVHFINEEADKGDIILQEIIDIDPDIYVSDLQLKFIKIYRKIVVDALKLIQTNRIQLIPQAHLLGTYYGKLKIHQCEIKPSMTIEEAYALIRAVSKPYHGAFWGKYIIWRAQRVSPQIQKLLIDQINDNGMFFVDQGVFLKLRNGIIEITKFEKYA
jgi:methionyl-tRNA formyltransferase